MSDFLFSLLSYYQISLKPLDIRKKQKDYKDLKTPYNLPDFLNVVNRIIKESNIANVRVMPLTTLIGDSF